MLFKKPKVKRKYKKKSPQKKEQEELDKIWTKKVKTRDNFTCQICHKKFDKVNAHHILPRGIKGMRWDPMNGITLCSYHHTLGVWSAHLNAIWFTFWFKTNKEQQFKYLINKLTSIGRPI